MATKKTTRNQSPKAKRPQPPVARKPAKKPGRSAKRKAHQWEPMPAEIVQDFRRTQKVPKRVAVQIEICRRCELLRFSMGEDRSYIYMNGQKGSEAECVPASGSSRTSSPDENDLCPHCGKHHQQMLPSDRIFQIASRLRETFLNKMKSEPNFAPGEGLHTHLIVMATVLWIDEATSSAEATIERVDHVAETLYERATTDLRLRKLPSLTRGVPS